MSARPADQPPAPYLRIQTVTVPVADLDRSLFFYRTRLGFTILHESVAFTGARIGLVAPPDGSAILVLSQSDPDHRLGTATGISLLTDDLDAQYLEWSSRGVSFGEAPQPSRGARHVTFRDLDGNAFHLVEADVVSRQLEAEREAAAARAERERRAAHEIAIAMKVQAGLFPQQRPPVTTLDYEGRCIQARAVGGDYFDFLDFGGGRLGLVIGDVSGKGLGAALLMANLQAHIRGQFARHADDLPGLLTSVNRLFKQSAPAASYATLFFGLYDDRARRLRFVNCGHPPPLLLRADRRTERLDATSWVLGMFDEWAGYSGEVQLAAGDTLVLYTDGVTEIADGRGDEFGATRLADAVRSAEPELAVALLDRAIAAARRFGGAEPVDDITMVVARCVDG